MEIDAKAEYPQDMFDLLQELGLFTLPFPAEYGGSGSLVSACLAIEEFGRVCYNTAYLLLLQWVPFGSCSPAATRFKSGGFCRGSLPANCAARSR
jgi:alkylation response protein AidB-like acyl-CoA dehydrogenase